MITAEYHNARACVGQDLWIACLVGQPGIMWATIKECATEQEAIEHLDQCLTTRDLHGIPIKRVPAAGESGQGIDYQRDRRPRKQPARPARRRA